MRILLVEDERPLARVIERGLLEEGYAVDVANGLRAARVHLARQRFDAIVLDLGLPDGDGTVLCHEVRAAGSATGVLMLTARSDVPERIAGLDAGADDYLAKPFDFGELAARLRALLRRPSAVHAPLLTVGDLVVDVPARRVSVGGVVVPLTTREFALLHHLAAHADSVVSRTELIDALWDSDYDGFSNVIDVHVRNLRRKLDRPGHPLPLETVRGAGYRLSATAPAPIAVEPIPAGDAH